MSNLIANTAYWFASFENVNALAAWLKDHDIFDDIDDVLYFFSEPWKYEAEWDHLHGSPHERKACVICTDDSPDDDERPYNGPPNVASIAPAM